MKVICDKVRDGIRILRCFSYDGQVELPEQIGGFPIRELGAYMCSEVVRRQEPGEKYLAEIIEAGGRRSSDAFGGEPGHILEPCAAELAAAEALEDGTPALKGNDVQSVSLPSGLRKIGAYAFYNCENLERLEFYSSLKDLGAGLFTGCRRIGQLDMHVVSGAKSCLKEVLAELRQTLRVNCLNEQGKEQARLLFPEYYEESIENTPARILTQEMHGCGHRYRNAFSGTDFQYLTYDKLFPHIQVQEKPELVTELVLGRLMYPVQLLEERRQIYEEYAAGHGPEIFWVAAAKQDWEILKFAARADWCGRECLDGMLEECNRKGDPQALGILMDIRHERKRRRSEGCLEGRSAGCSEGHLEGRFEMNRTEDAGAGTADEMQMPARESRGQRRRRRFEL